MIYHKEFNDSSLDTLSLLFSVSTRLENSFTSNADDEFLKFHLDLIYFCRKYYLFRVLMVDRVGFEPTTGGGNGSVKKISTFSFFQK